MWHNTFSPEILHLIATTIRIILKERLATLNSHFWFNNEPVLSFNFCDEALAF